MEPSWEGARMALTAALALVSAAEGTLPRVQMRVRSCLKSLTCISQKLGLCFSVSVL